MADIDITSIGGNSSVGGGFGMEFLMNDNVLKQANARSTHLGDVSDLENDLNDLMPPPTPPAHEFGGSSIRFEEPTEIPSSSFSGGAEDLGVNQTYDGFAHYNTIPENVSNNNSGKSATENLKEKLILLKKLQRFEKQGVELYGKYSTESSITEMQAELEAIEYDINKTINVAWQRAALGGFFSNLEQWHEYIPLDVNLNGLSMAYEERQEDFDPIFGDVHEEWLRDYKPSALTRLGMEIVKTVGVVSYANKKIEGIRGGGGKGLNPQQFGNVMMQDPEVMRRFNEANIQSLASSNHPSNQQYAGYMANVAGGIPFGNPPPRPVAPDALRAEPPYTTRGGNMYTNRQLQQQQQAQPVRPDLAAARAQNSQGSFLSQSAHPTAAPTASNGIMQQTPATARRPEMKGPSDVSALLSGLRTKTLQMPAATSPPPPQQNDIRIQPSQVPQPLPQSDDTMSIGSGGATSLGNMSMAKRAARGRPKKERSAKNIVSLDI